jgi:hypothetical protein
MLGLAISLHPGTTTRNELLKAQMCSGALCKLRQNLVPRITFINSSFLEWTEITTSVLQKIFMKALFTCSVTTLVILVYYWREKHTDGIL